MNESPFIKDKLLNFKFHYMNPTMASQSVYLYFIFSDVTYLRSL